MPARVLLRELPRALSRFVALEQSGGIVIIVATCAALVAANTGLAGAYAGLTKWPVVLGFESVGYAGTLKSFTKDVLMVPFFFAIGMELKREMAVGVLRQRAQIVLPLLAALGGMVVPAIVFLLVNAGSPANLRGWAIPTATDIAFALAVLLIAARTLPPALKIFLLAIAIFDDLGAILIIATIYSGHLAAAPLLLAAALIGALVLLNRARVASLLPYAAVGMALAVALEFGGIHATLAGVVTGLLVPATETDDEHGLLARAIHGVHPWVTFGVLPLFAFVSAGVPLAGLALADLLAPLPLGIALGLFLGKQAGVMAGTLLAVRSGLAALPEGVTWRQVHAVSMLAGVGFTMSLFIGYLAFDSVGAQNQVTTGVLAGSVLSALAGAIAARLAGQVNS